MSFEKTEVNTVNRYKDRARYDVDTIQAIVNEAKVVHVAFVDDHGRPQCLPVLGAFEQADDGACYIYLHGYPSSGFIKTLSDEGTSLVVTATLIDGIVLSLAVFGHSMNFRSAVCHGVVAPFTQAELDAGAKMNALKIVVETAVPGRWEQARKPTEAEARRTAVLRMRVEDASAKVRTGPPKEERADMDNAELVAKTWTGVVPKRLASDTPVPTAYCPIDTPIPDHVLKL